MSKILTLHLKKKWWDKIASGEKTIEYRLATQYWLKILMGKDYDEIHLWLGYPKKTDREKLIIRKFTRVWFDRILHEEFGIEAVDVFCIEVGVVVK